MPRVFSSRSRAPECGWSNVKGALQTLSATHFSLYYRLLFYFTLLYYIYLYSRLTTNPGQHPYYSSRKKTEGSGRRGRSARLIASRQRKFSRCRYQDSVLSCRSIESSSSSSFEKERSNLDRKLETRGLRLLRGSSLSLIDIYDLGCFRIKRMLRSTI